MNDLIIWLTIGVIVVIQIWVFIVAYIKIKHLKAIYPDSEDLKKVNYLNHLGLQIECHTKAHPVFQQILNSINTYLSKNKGAASDFNLIKDIADRNTDALDEEVNALLPLPLYLGLMGTMAGIIIGLFNVDLVNFTESSITELIGGVKIAMIASLLGLVFTSWLSGYIYKGAKSQVEATKNNFFTFIQTELLPVLSLNAVSGMHMLEQNLTKFNETFGDKISSFDAMLSRILDTFEMQIEVMKDLKDINVVEITQSNITLLKNFKESTKEFGQFKFYLDQVNSFVGNSITLNNTINEQLQGTQDIRSIAQVVQENVGQNKQLLEYIQVSMAEINSRKEEVGKTVADVDKYLQDSISKLSESAVNGVRAMQAVAIKEFSLLEKLMTADSGNFGELKKIPQLVEGIVKIETLLTNTLGLLYQQTRENAIITQQQYKELQQTLTLVAEQMRPQTHKGQEQLTAKSFSVKQIIGYAALFWLVCLVFAGAILVLIWAVNKYW